MQVKEALILINSLIEQANGLGMFKKLQELDLVREAFNVLNNFVKDTPNEPG